jgi:uncharacterized integral membrane protein
MRSSNKHSEYVVAVVVVIIIIIIIIIIISDASTVTVVIFHQLQGLGIILLSQHPTVCKPTENKNIH